MVLREKANELHNAPHSKNRILLSSQQKNRNKKEISLKIDLLCMV